jgi:taurine dioxygenase
MRLRSLHPAFGAEVLDFDVLKGGAPEEIAALRAGFDEHQLLLFRGAGQAVPPERQVEISAWFGPPIANSEDGVLWTVLHNEEPAGSARLPFHSDLSYTDDPILGLSLQAVELPPGGSATAFVSGVHAWRTLPQDLQALLADKTLRHRLASSLAKGFYGDWPEFVADHPVRLEHPRTGAPVLYVTEHHAERIHELDEATSARVLAGLYAHLYAPEHVYAHQWALHDLIVWDNLSIQHARPEVAEPALGPRAMQRVALAEVPYHELVERARRQERERAPAAAG